MKQVKAPSFSSPTVGKKEFTVFRGVDWSLHPVKIDDSRSPDMVNMIAAPEGYPVKRLGFRTIASFAPYGRINGVWRGVDQDGRPIYYVHAGAALLRVDEDFQNPVVLDVVLRDEKSTGFWVSGRFYVLDGEHFLRLTKTGEASHVADNAYTPLIRYNIAPGKTGAGTEYERLNMLSSRVKESFRTQAAGESYYLWYRAVSGSVRVELDGTQLESTQFTVSNDVVYTNLGGRRYCSYIKITDSALSVSASQIPNMVVSYQVNDAFEDFTFGAMREKICKCTVVGKYGYGNDNRVFLSGNPDYPGWEWYSGLSDPSYWPELNYSVVGMDNNPIKTYIKFAGELIAVKADNHAETAIWHHSAELTDSGTVFPLREGVTGIGAVCAGATANLENEPLFLSREGVFAPTVTYTYARQQEGVEHRSARVSPKLKEEENLAEAVATVWRRRYFLALNGRVYIADGNQKKDAGCYEWYYWEGVPVRVFAQFSDDLIFGTADGRICRYNDDLTDADGEPTMEAYNDDGAAIPWRWCSKVDDLGYPTRLKTLEKRGNALEVVGYDKASVSMIVRSDRNPGHEVELFLGADSRAVDRDDPAHDIYGRVRNGLSFKAKEKKFRYIQIILSGRQRSDAFGLFGMTLRYTLSDYAKRQRGGK